MLGIVEQAALAFRRFDLIAFMGNMKRFATIMQLEDDDNPLAEKVTEEEVMKAPLTDREKQIAEMKKKTEGEESNYDSRYSFLDLSPSSTLSVEEMTRFYAQNCRDANLISTLQSIDELNEKGLTKEGAENHCTSLSLLAMQQYFFYWCLCLLMCGDYSK